MAEAEQATEGTEAPLGLAQVARCDGIVPVTLWESEEQRRSPLSSHRRIFMTLELWETAEVLIRPMSRGLTFPRI